MRSLTAVVAAALILLAVPGAGSLAKAPAQPLLLVGTLRDGANRPVSGRLLLFHDNLRDGDRLQFLGTARSGANGRFEMRFAGNGSTRTAAMANDGFVNFAVIGSSADRVSALTFFSARRQPDGSWHSSATDLRRFELATSRRAPSADYANKLEEQLGREPAAHARRGTVQANGTAWLDDCYYDLVGAYDRPTPVLELHTWYSDLQGRAVYGQTRTADSDITVGVKYDEFFSMQGTTHIGNSHTVSSAIKRTGRFGRVLQSEFRYNHWRFRTPNNFICSAAPREIIQAVRWNGTGLLPMWDDSRFDGQCTTTYRANRAALWSDAEWSRWSEELTWYEWTLEAAAGLKVATRARSGASTRVGYEYATGTARSIYYLCGNNDKPAYSLRIFAGH